MAIIGWIFRIIAILMIVRIVLRMFAGLRRAAGGGAATGPAGSRTPQTREGGRLVRDPQCGTHIPQARAVAWSSRGETHYFCSTRCRDEWSAARKAS
jgi:YHS domain-containing protein